MDEANIETNESEVKDTFDDSIEFMFKKDYLGKTKFSNGWQMAAVTRYTSSCSRICQVKRESKEEQIRILDLGCSNKTFLRFWYTNYENPARPRVSYVGLEYRQDVVDEANNKRYNSKVNNDEVLQFDLINQSLFEVNRHEKYDVILMQEILEHIPREKVFQLLEEAYQLLSDRGMIVVSSPNPKRHEGQEFVWPENHIQEFPLDEMKSMVSQHFTIERVNGWLGKANYFKKRISETELDLYNSLRGISSGFASAIIAYRNPEVAECYSIIATK